ncbi:hypothetical protein SHKM778_44270 [Streptomyces sp. KM77-8]|uniref:Uncharacterized protein n=1 Tax=Streptomyces haneummycinicus TaxID=3074435 RepID=A0AAT9HL54_9ACTN
MYDEENPDVFLDVPLLKVDEIDLDVEDLRAHVSLQTEVLDLLRLSVGADVTLGRVHLGISGVEAQAQLRVRLDNVAAIVNRVLTTLDNNPEILRDLARGVGSAVQDVGGEPARPWASWARAPAAPFRTWARAPEPLCGTWARAPGPPFRMWARAPEPPFRMWARAPGPPFRTWVKERAGPSTTSVEPPGPRSGMSVEVSARWRRT